MYRRIAELLIIILMFSKSVVTEKYFFSIKYSNTLIDVPKYAEEVPTQIMSLIKNWKSRFEIIFSQY